MAEKKIRVTITIDPNIVSKGKKVAGLVPFSRYIEHLIILNIGEPGEAAAEESKGMVRNENEEGRPFRI